MTSIEFKTIFYDWHFYNKEIFIVINKISNIGYIPNILYYLSMFFNIENFVVYYFLMLIYFYNKLSKSDNKQEYFNSSFDYLFRFGTSYAMIGLSYAVLKFTVNFQRPFCSLYSPDFITVIDYANERCLSSFPSGHAAMGVLFLYYNWGKSRTFNVILILNLLLLTLSRITLSMHYPADIFYSIIFSFILIKLSNLTLKLFKNNIIKSIKKLVSSIILIENIEID